MMLADLRHHPCNRLTNFAVSIIEKQHKVLEARHDDAHKLKLLRTLGYSSKCDESRVALLPVGVLDVVRNEMDDRQKDIVADDQRDCI